LRIGGQRLSRRRDLSTLGLKVRHTPRRALVGRVDGEDEEKHSAWRLARLEALKEGAEE